MHPRLLPLFAGLALLGSLAPLAAHEAEPLVPSITVTGTGSASAKPDQGVVQVGVVTQADTASAALQENNQAMKRLFDTLRSHDVAPKDIQTTSFNVTPQHKRGPRGEFDPEIIGYQVTNQVRVKVRQLDNLGRLLDALVGGGANRVQGIQFTVAEPDPVLDQARREAMREARRKAELYAQAAGVNLGRVLLIQEESPRVPQPRPYQLAAARQASAVPIAEGEQEFQANITVTYALGAGK